MSKINISGSLLALILSRFGPAVRRQTGKRTTSVQFPASALQTLQKLWSVDNTASRDFAPHSERNIKMATIDARLDADISLVATV